MKIYILNNRVMNHRVKPGSLAEDEKEIPGRNDWSLSRSGRRWQNVQRCLSFGVDRVITASIFAFTASRPAASRLFS